MSPKIRHQETEIANKEDKKTEISIGNNNKLGLRLQFGFQPVNAITLNTHKDKLFLVQEYYVDCIFLESPNFARSIMETIAWHDVIICSRKLFTIVKNLWLMWMKKIWHYHKCPFKQDIGHNNNKNTKVALISSLEHTKSPLLNHVL